MKCRRRFVSIVFGYVTNSNRYANWSNALTHHCTRNDFKSEYSSGPANGDRCVEAGIVRISIDCGVGRQMRRFGKADIALVVRRGWCACA